MNQGLTRRRGRPRQLKESSTYQPTPNDLKVLRILRDNRENPDGLTAPCLQDMARLSGEGLNKLLHRLQDKAGAVRLVGKPRHTKIYISATGLKLLSQNDLTISGSEVRTQSVKDDDRLLQELYEVHSQILERNPLAPSPAYVAVVKHKGTYVMGYKKVTDEDRQKLERFADALANHLKGRHSPWDYLLTRDKTSLQTKISPK